MPILSRDYGTDHMNYLQFATNAYLEDLNYEDYKASAISCGKHVLTETELIRHYEDCEAQAMHYRDGA